MFAHRALLALYFKYSCACGRLVIMSRIDVLIFGLFLINLIYLFISRISSARYLVTNVFLISRFSANNCGNDIVRNMLSIITFYIAKLNHMEDVYFCRFYNCTINNLDSIF
jgi:hypothetical protein